MQHQGKLRELELTPVNEMPSTDTGQIRYQPLPLEKGLESSNYKIRSLLSRRAKGVVERGGNYAEWSEWTGDTYAIFAESKD